MATYPPRRLLGARPLPSDPRRDPRRSDFPGGGGGSPRNLRCLFTHFQGPAARHHQLLRRNFKEEQHFMFFLPFFFPFPQQFLPASSAFPSTM
ncbi:uncharacterized protein AAG666_022636 isoform 4-T5 [Megaptera novaeangliae]